MLEAFTVPVIPNCDPLNVRLLLSCNAPAPVIFPVTSNEVSVPTFVSEELTTPEPRVVAFSTDVLLILYDLPDAIFKCSDDAKLSPVASNWNVLLPSPDAIVIPPPFAAASLAEPVAT